MGSHGWVALALLCAHFCKDRLYLGGYAHSHDLKACYCRDEDGADRVPLWVPPPMGLTLRIRPDTVIIPPREAESPPAPLYHPQYDLSPYGHPLESDE